MNLSRVLAQAIANKVMLVIPYNVNIMDEAGRIIGSGEATRIGTYHKGAVAALEQGAVVTIVETTETLKPGVNIPIRFKNKIIGVIGISGDPHIVESFASLVRVTAELLIEQEFSFKERRMNEQMKEEFLYQWVFRLDEYDSAFLSNGEDLGINLIIERKAIIVKGKISKEPYLKDQEFSFKLNESTILFIAPHDSDLLKRLEPLVSDASVKIGIGESSKHIAKSVQSARRAIEIVEKMDLPTPLCDYRELKFIDYLTNKDQEFTEVSHYFKELEVTAKGQELIDTLLCYIKHSGDINAISSELHIHRNSLAYRLQRIEILTNKNPKKSTDLFQPYTGYVINKMKNQPSV